MNNSMKKKNISSDNKIIRFFLIIIIFSVIIIIGLKVFGITFDHEAINQFTSYVVLFGGFWMLSCIIIANLIPKRWTQRNKNIYIMSGLFIMIFGGIIGSTIGVLLI